MIGFDDADRADLAALTADDALVHIDKSGIILNGDGVGGADLFAFAAADAAVGAYLSGAHALIMVEAGHMDWLVQRIERDEIFGAFPHTQAAAGAFFRPNNSHAVDDVNSEIGSGLGAIPVSETAIGAAGIAAEIEGR